MVENSVKSWMTFFREHTLQDLIAICLPWMALATFPVIAAALLYDPTMKLLLYAAVPEDWRTGPCFWACFMAELHFLAMLDAIVISTWQLQVISFELLNTKLETVGFRAGKRYGYLVWFCS